jgi:outer membrane protein
MRGETVRHRPHLSHRSFRRAVQVSLALLALCGAPEVRGQEPEAVRLTLAEALALAEQQNPDLAAARARVAAAVEGVEVVRRGTLPHLDLSAGWSYTDIPSAAFAHKLDAGEFTATDFELSRLNDPSAVSHLGTALAVEAPIDAFGKIRTAAESASARARSAGAQVDEGLLDLRFQVVAAYRRAVLAQRAVDITERSLAGSRSREADVEARVTGGAALQSDLLRSRARRREREADLAERRGDVKAAVAALARALGAPAGTLYQPIDEALAPAPLDGDLAVWTARALAARPALAATEAAVEAARQGVQGEDKSKLPDLGLWGQIQDNRIDLGGGKLTGAVGVSLRWRAFDPARDRRRAAAEAELSAAESLARAAADQVRLEVETAWYRAQAARERSAAAAGGAEEGREALRVVRERRLAGIATLTDELETEAASLAAELQELRAATEAALADAALERAAGDRS